MRSHPRLAVAGLLLLSTAIVGISRTPVMAQAVTNACKSNATGTFSDLSLSVSGTAAPDPAVAGVDTITLSGVSFQASVPATLLVSGYNLGLLTVGLNNIPVKGWVAIQGTNTAEGTTVQTFSLTVTTTISDPNGVPGNGDETATPLEVSVGLGDSTWTPLGGTIEFKQAGPGSLPTIPAGEVAVAATTPAGSVFINAQVANGLIKANFDCQAGTSAVGGASFTPASPGPFETVAVTGGQEPTTTTAGETTTTTAAATTTAVSTATTATTVPPATTAAVATTAPATVSQPRPVTGELEYVTTCTNSITPDVSEIRFVARGTTNAPIGAGTKFDVTNQRWTVTVPASVFQAGLNLSVLTPGQVVTGKVDVSVLATNTVEGKHDTTGLVVSIPVAVDAAGQALPASVDFTLPDTRFTSKAGEVALTFQGSTMNVDIGIAVVKFVCKTTGSTPYLRVAVVEQAGPATTVHVVVVSAIPVTGTSDSVLIQVLIGLALLDLGYLFLSLLRRPNRTGSPPK